MKAWYWLRSIRAVCWMKAMGDMLLPEGLVLYSSKHGNRVEYTSNEAHIDIPMAVLVNEYSASASEVLSVPYRTMG